MKKKSIAWLLLLTMLFTLVPASLSVSAANAYAADTAAGKHLEQQLANVGVNHGKLSVIVALDDEWMKSNKGLSYVPVEERRDYDLMKQQIEYSRNARKVFKDIAEENNINLDVTQTYDMGFSGMALDTTVADARKIAELPCVKDVEVSITFKAPILEKANSMGKYDTSSNGMVNAENAWNQEYSGQGQLIAVIDSGCDPNHPALQNIDGEMLKYSSSSQIADRIKTLGIMQGKYFSKKIPFGFNYVNKNTHIKEADAYSHGMHVAGIIAANSDELKGIAPNAQVAVMRVFGDSLWGGGTSSAIYNKAIDDAVKLGCDSINMSLGAPAGSVSDIDVQETLMLKNAQQMGIIVAMAAGNESFSGKGAVENPSAENPDYGILSSPAVSPYSIAVASIENKTVASKGIVVEGIEGKTIKFVDSGIGKLSEDFVTLKYCGYGHVDEIVEVSKDDNVYALIQRGERSDKEILNFVDKVRNADNKGYTGVIVYDNEANAPLFKMETPQARIPSALVSNEDGLFLKENIDKKIKFSEKFVFGANKNAGKISYFSSWGLTPEGNIKPDITAPGGHIFSTLNSGTYGDMSGTSMASPHVAAGIAIVKQRVEREFNDKIKGFEKYRLIKNLLMSAAEPISDKESKWYCSPRQQGAGLMNLDAAVKTPAVFEGTNGIASINLGNVNGGEISVTGKIRNLTDRKLTYTLRGVLNTDKVKDGKVLLTPMHLADSDRQTITIEGGQSVDFTVKMQVPEDFDPGKEMKNGFFTEGFIFAQSDNDADPEISIPYVGFCGNFQKLSVIEKPIYDFAGSDRPYYYDMGKVDKGTYFTHLGGIVDNKEVVLGENMNSTHENPIFEKEHIAFSPDNDGNTDKAVFYGNFLRNYQAFKMTVTDADNKKMKVLEVPGDSGKKNYYLDPGRYSVPYANMIQTKKAWAWDGSDMQGNQVEEGTYYMSVAAKAENSDEYGSEIKMPIIVDRTFPRVMKAHFEGAAGNTYVVDNIKEEGGSGINAVYIKNDAGDMIKPEIRDGKYYFDVSAVDKATSALVVCDYAYNKIELPMTSAERTGNELTVRVQGRTSGEALSNSAFSWFVENEDGIKQDAYNMKPGHYKLVIDRVDPGYKLVGNKSIDFEVKSGVNETVINVNFEKLVTRTVTLSVSNPFNAPVAFTAVDKVTGREFTVTKVTDMHYETLVPIGSFKIRVDGIGDDSVVIFPNGDEVEILEEHVTNIVQVNISKKEEVEVTFKLHRGDYKGALTLQLTGVDTSKTEQTVDFAADENNKTVTLYGIKSTIKGANFSSPYYSVKNNTEWNGVKKTCTVKIQKNTEADPNFIDKSKLKKLIEEAEAIKAVINEQYEYDEMAFKYFDLVLEGAYVVANDENASQESINGIYNNLKLGINRLVKKGEDPLKNARAELQDVINHAKSLEKSDYEKATWENLEKVLKEASSVVLSGKNKTDIERAQRQLERALGELRRIDGKALTDKSKLKAAIDKFRNLDKSKYDTTSDAWMNLEYIVEDAEDIYEKGFPSEKAMNAAIERIEAGLKILNTGNEEPELPKPSLQISADRANLYVATEYSKTLEKDKFKRGWTKFESALKAAENTLKSDNESDIKASLDKLDAAILGLYAKKDIDEALTGRYNQLEELIKMNANSKDAVLLASLRKTYNELPDEDKELVFSIAKLDAAEKALNKA